MIQLTCSLAHWLFVNYPDKVALIMMGHTELLTEAMWKDYVEWCQTDEGESYLKGGENYKE